MMFKNNKGRNFAVLGLGRFGMSLVRTLSEHDVSILACDKNAALTQEAAEYATSVVEADVSDEKALNALGLGNFDVVIIAMANEFEASQIATMVAREQGARHIIVKVSNLRQKKILEHLGVDQVILPEQAMGVKIARQLVNPNITAVLEESELYTISEMTPLDEWVGKTIREADIRRQHDIMVLAVRRGDKMSVPVSPDWTLMAEDILVVLSEHKK
jgi:trk system potassium uptake protein TrkA